MHSSLANAINGTWLLLKNPHGEFVLLAWLDPWHLQCPNSIRIAALLAAMAGANPGVEKCCCHPSVHVANNNFNTATPMPILN